MPPPTGLLRDSIGFEPTGHKTSGFDEIARSDFGRRVSAGPERACGQDGRSNPTLSASNYNLFSYLDPFGFA
jgi:hypothetical protein